MNKEEIDKWLDEEYGCSYTRLEKLHDFYFEKYTDLKKENKQLKEELEIYRMVGKDKSIRNLLIKDISKYIVKKSKMIENDRK